VAKNLFLYFSEQKLKIAAQSATGSFAHVTDISWDDTPVSQLNKVRFAKVVLTLPHRWLHSGINVHRLFLMEVLRVL
jgi:hypothetical protein